MLEEDYKNCCCNIVRAYEFLNKYQSIECEEECWFSDAEPVVDICIDPHKSEFWIDLSEREQKKSLWINLNFFFLVVFPSHLFFYPVLHIQITDGTLVLCASFIILSMNGRKLSLQITSSESLDRKLRDIWLTDKLLRGIGGIFNIF